MHTYRNRKQDKRGFTLMEMMVIIAVIAILVVVTVPAITSIRQTLMFRQRNDYAKSIYLAVQTNLTRLRSEGRLVSLQMASEDETKAKPVPEAGTASAYFPEEDYSSQYFYTSNMTEFADRTAFDKLLPVGSIDDTLRDKNIFIEYNPVSGNVYSVFYSEEGIDLTYANLTRDEAERKEIMLGYYCGDGLDKPKLEIISTNCTVSATMDGQEALLEVTIAIPDAYITSPVEFLEALKANITLTGEQSFNSYEVTGIQGTRNPDLTSPVVFEIRDGNTVVFSYRIDSLYDNASFASLVTGKPVSELTVNQSDPELARSEADALFSGCLLPGENLTIEAKLSFGDDAEFSTVQMSGVNSLFSSMQVEQVGVDEYGYPIEEYLIFITNGRHLQNLNALHPAIAEHVVGIYFEDNVYWNETVDYYNKKYSAGSSFSNNGSEAPLRALPYFVPVANETLMGAANFGNGRTPVLSDSPDMVDRATVNGAGYGVYYLNIDSNLYKAATTPGSNGKATYASGVTTVDQYGGFTGLFAYANTTISNLRIVNPIVRGREILGTSTPATGALVGAAGYKTFIYDCGVYLDLDDRYFDGAKMKTSLSDGDVGKYGVTGQGAVGGMVGFAKSHKTLNGVLTNDEGFLAFSNSFAAVPVYGKLHKSDVVAQTFKFGKNYGYVDGVGGLVGCTLLTNFYNCYASGNVNADNVSEYIWDLTDFFVSTAEASLGVGAGGFVGTSHGAKYTNCFATGDVHGYNDIFYQSSCVGGFIGVMGFMECFEEADVVEGVETTVEFYQASQFHNCYAAGTAKISFNELGFFEIVNSTAVTESFAGYVAKGNVVNSDFGLADTGLPQYYNYYDYVNATGSVPAAGRNPQYIFRDSYYMNLYADGESKIELGDNYSQYCALSCFYEELCDLPGNYSTFSSVVWGPADANNTHAYTFVGAQAYPFSKLNRLDYYGDWPSRPLGAGLAYFEQYSDGDYGYRLERAESSGDILRDEVIVEDGYAILVAAEGLVTVSVGGQTFEALNEMYIEDVGFIIPRYEVAFTYDDTIDFGGENQYKVLYLSDEILRKAMETAAASDSYYIDMKISVCGGKVEDWWEGASHKRKAVPDESTRVTYTVYFNPFFANTQVNGYMTLHKDASGNYVESMIEPQMPENPPANTSIRTAGQLYNLTTLGDKKISSTEGDVSYWSLNYVQELDIDTSTYYEGEEVPALTSIGSAADPYTGTFQGRGKEIRGFTLGSAGLFGHVGRDGKVSNLTLNCTAVTEAADDAVPEYAGLVAGYNSGVIENIQVRIEDVALTAVNAAGGIAGYNEGGIHDCSVGDADGDDTVLSGSLSLTARYTGGLVGCSAPDLTNAISYGITGCRVAVDRLTLNSTDDGYAGGFAGLLSNINYSLADALVCNDISGSGTLGGFAGSMENCTISRMTLKLDSMTGSGFSAALVGHVVNTNMDNCNVYLGGPVTGTSGAAGFALEVDQLSNLRNNIVQISRDNITGFDTASGYSIISSGGTAAGFVVENYGTIVNCHVMLDKHTDDEIEVTIRGKRAYGFAETNGGQDTLGSMTECTVSGAAVIEGTQEATGFLGRNDYGVVTKGMVTPARKDLPLLDGYRENSNESLTIRAGSSGIAAGFAVENAQNQSLLKACSALGTVTAGDKGTAAGFALYNSGSIQTSTANTTLSSAENTSVSSAGFVYENKAGALVEDCYAWYLGDDVEYGFVGTNENLINSSYCAPLSISAKNLFVGDGKGTYENCFGVYIGQSDKETSSIDGVTYIPREDLQVKAAELNNKRNVWMAGDDDSRKSYPFDINLYVGNDAYCPYPTLASVTHYGDWIRPAVHSYGMVYYEVIDGVTYYHVDDMTDGVNDDGTDYNGYYKDVTVDGVTTTTKLDSNPFAVPTGTQIQDSGYAVFYYKNAVPSVSGAVPLDRDKIKALPDLSLALLADKEDVHIKQMKSEVLTDVYGGVAQDDYFIVTGRVYQGENGNEPIDKTTYMVPYFADALFGQEDMDAAVEAGQQWIYTFRVRTAQHLDNLCWLDRITTFGSEFTMNQTHDIDLTGRQLRQVRNFKGIYTGAYTENGVQKKATITGYNGSTALFGIVADTGILEDITLVKPALMEVTANTGILAGTNQGHITGCSLTGASLFAKEGGENLTLGLIAGENSGAVEDCVVSPIPATASAPAVPVTITGKGTIGGLVGRNADTGLITGSTLTEALITGSGADDKLGGLAGVSTGSIADSVVTKPVIAANGTKVTLGGVAAISKDMNNTKVENLTVQTGTALTGDIVLGGLVGVNTGSMNASTVSITALNLIGANVTFGGAAAQNGNGGRIEAVQVTTNGVTLSAPSGTVRFGGLVGSNSGAVTGANEVTAKAGTGADSSRTPAIVLSGNTATFGGLVDNYSNTAVALAGVFTAEGAINVTSLNGNVTFGGLAGTNSGSVSASAAFGKHAATLSATGTVTLGGAVARNSGTVSSCAATGLNVTITNGTVTAGGLVGMMEGGSLTDSSAAGNIIKGSSSTGAFIGGAIGTENTDDTQAVISGTNTTVDIAGWNGTVGRFTGYIYSGKYTTCTGTAAADSAVQFLGGIYRNDNNKLSGITHKSENVVDADEAISPEEPIVRDDTNNSYTGFVPTTSATPSYNEYLAELENCTYTASGTTYTQQILPVANYFSSVENLRQMYNAQLLTKEECYDTVGSTIYFKNLVNTDNVDTATSYYGLNDNGEYVQVFVRRTSGKNYIITYYNYTAFCHNNDGTEKILGEGEGSSWSDNVTLPTVYEKAFHSVPKSNTIYLLAAESGGKLVALANNNGSVSAVTLNQGTGDTSFTIFGDSVDPTYSKVAWTYTGSMLQNIQGQYLIYDNGIKISTSNSKATINATFYKTDDDEVAFRYYDGYTDYYLGYDGGFKRVDSIDKAYLKLFALTPGESYTEGIFTYQGTSFQCYSMCDGQRTPAPGEETLTPASESSGEDPVADESPADPTEPVPASTDPAGEEALLPEEPEDVAEPTETTEPIPGAEGQEPSAPADQG